MERLVVGLFTLLIFSGMFMVAYMMFEMINRVYYVTAYTMVIVCGITASVSMWLLIIAFYLWEKECG